MLQRYLFVLLFFCFLFAHGQKEMVNWYFGDEAGIRFNEDGTVTTLLDGKMSSIEGCASISDAEGNLLLYTNGTIVYNREHEVMMNGRGLAGDETSSQSAIIVPKPNDPHTIYIFTIDTSNSSNNFVNIGMNYSEVDLSGDNGKGRVVVKNIRLLDKCTEKIAAVVKDCTGSVWVITLASEDGKTELYNTYHSFLVGPDGVNTTSIKSSFDDLSSIDNNPGGYLKFSPGGTKVASANIFEALYLYDFDIETGKLSNQQQISTLEKYYHYGVEFSQNRRFLYTSAYKVSAKTYSLLQFDLNATNIAESLFEFESISPTGRGALQMGPNGIIYLNTGGLFLDVINSPDLKGASAGFQRDAIDLGGRNGESGLPPSIQSFIIPLVIDENGNRDDALTLCEGESFILRTDAIDDAIYNWEKDGISFDNPAPILEVNTANLDHSGKYTLEIIPPNSICSIISEARIVVHPAPNAPDITIVQCDIDIEDSTDGITKFNLEKIIEGDINTYTFYETEQDILDNRPIPDPTNYSSTSKTIHYTVTNEFCLNTSPAELALEVVATPESLPLKDTFYTCDLDADDGELIGTFDLDLIRTTNYPGFDVEFYTTKNTDVELDNSYTTEPTIILARVGSNNKCLSVDRIQLQVKPKPDTIEFGGEVILCVDNDAGATQIEAPSGYDTYQWYKVGIGNSMVDLGNLPHISIDSIGEYLLQVGLNHTTDGQTCICTNETSFTVVPSNRAEVMTNIKDLSDNNIIEVMASGEGDYEYSLDGIHYQNSNIFENVVPGILTVYVNDKNGCGISEQEISVIGYPKFFTPNGDGTNDFWQILGANDQFQAQSMIFIFDRYGKLVSQIRPESIGWNGYYNNRQLPPSDYWFKVLLQDGREFKGHFALKL